MFVPEAPIPVIAFPFVRIVPFWYAFVLGVVADVMDDTPPER